LHEQVAAAIRRSIAEGEAVAGQRLPRLARHHGYRQDELVEMIRTLS
jgi:DNA-binding FadR family transcriptional regulator